MDPKSYRAFRETGPCGDEIKSGSNVHRACSILTYIQQSFRCLQRILFIGWVNSLLCDVQIKWLRLVVGIYNPLSYFCIQLCTIVTAFIFDRLQKSNSERKIKFLPPKSANVLEQVGQKRSNWRKENYKKKKNSNSVEWSEARFWILCVENRAGSWDRSVKRAFSGCCAIMTSHKKGETAVYGYNLTLFWVLSVSCWCLEELIFS